MKNTIKAAIVALAMSALAVGGVSANTYFWRSGPHLLPLPSSVTDPGEGEPTAQHLTLSHDMPSEVIAGQGYSAHLAVSGNDGRALTYSVEPAVPVFISITSDGEILIDPIAADAGEHAGIVFTVFDGTTSFHTDPVSMTVLPASGAFSLPLVASGDGTSLDRSLVFDGNDATKVTLSANGDSVVATYPAPIAAKGALVSASGNASFAIDAFVGSVWKTAATSGVIGELDQDVNAVDGRSLVSAKWRLRKVSGGSMDLREFRPGSAPANPVPVFDLPSAALASNGESAVISAFSPSTYYSSAPVTVAMAPGTVVPTGVSLGADGTLSVAADAILSGGTWNFDVVATDGSGFTSTRGYSVISVADPASTIMAKDFSNDGTVVGYQHLYDGDVTNAWSTTIAQNKAVTVDFGKPVSFDKVYIAFGGAQSVRIEYESAGQWVNDNRIANSGDISSTFAGDIAMGQTIVARRIRAVSTGSVNLALRELRVGSGPAHAAPSIDQSGVIATLGSSPMSVDLTATVSQDYANVSGSPVFEVASGTLPTGAVLTGSGHLSLPSINDVTGFSWSVGVKVTDAAGFTGQKTLEIATPAVPASQALPVSATLNGAAINLGLLYDGVTTSGSIVIPTSSAQYVEFDFGRAVKFSNATTAVTAGTVTLYYEVNGTFVTDGTTMTSTNMTVPIAFTERTAKKIRLVQNGPVQVVINEFRLGTVSAPAPVQASPTITQTSGYLASLSASSSQALVSGTSPANNYPVVAVDAYSITGTYPPGTTISPSGQLTLPAAGTGEQVWDFTVTHTSPVGLTASKLFRVGQNIADAANSLPTTFTIGTSQTNIAIPLLYDGIFDQITTNNSVEIDFGKNVKVNSIYAYTATSVTFSYDPFNTGNFVDFATVSGGGATFTGFPPVAGRKFKARSTNAFYEIRLGGGPAHLGTVDQSVGIAATLQTTATTLQLTGSGSPLHSTTGGLTGWTGSPPLGWSLSSTGMLSMPARPASGPASYAIAVEANDSAGFRVRGTVTINRL